jgi:hypothetical protein
MAREDRVERALEVFVYAPLGFGLWVRDLAPSLIDTMVSRGKAEIDRRQEQAQQHITTARSMGEVALAFGMPKLRERAEKQVSAVREQADRLVESFGAATTRTNGASGVPVPPAARTSSPPPRHAPTDDAPPAPDAGVEETVTSPGAAGSANAHRSASSAHLPIPGYDALSASQVVERLAGLGADELGAVRDYELANRKRRTILGKIDQLTA